MFSSWTVKDIFNCTSAKFLLQILLFGLFLYFFGIPAVERYQEKKVLVVKSVRDTGGLEAPAVTIIVKRNTTHTGWKKPDLYVSNFVQNSCGTKKRKNQTITACIEKRTFDRSEICTAVNIGVGRYSRPANVAWTEDFAHSYNGRQYTFNIDKKLRMGKPIQDFLRIRFKSNLEYVLYFHDPRYFYISRYPERAPPSVQKIVDPGKLPYYYRLGLTEVNEYNHLENPCNEDPNYNFNACVKERFARMVGCKTKAGLAITGPVQIMNITVLIISCKHSGGGRGGMKIKEGEKKLTFSPPFIAIYCLVVG